MVLQPTREPTSGEHVELDRALLLFEQCLDTALRIDERITRALRGPLPAGLT